MPFECGTIKELKHILLLNFTAVKRFYGFCFPKAICRPARGLGDNGTSTFCILYLFTSLLNFPSDNTHKAKQKLETMGRYSVETDAAVPHSKSRGSHLRYHFKHCREITHHIKGMEATKADKFLQNVKDMKDIVPFTKYTGGIGRKAMAKQHKAPGSKGRFPVKAAGVVKDLLSNAVANAESKGMDVDKLYIDHAQCNRAPPGRRRTYRAHGRIGKYASQPAHIELVLKERSEGVEKADDDEGEGARGPKITKKDAAKKRFVKVGGGSA